VVFTKGMPAALYWEGWYIITQSDGILTNHHPTKIMFRGLALKLLLIVNNY